MVFDIDILSRAGLGSAECIPQKYVTDHTQKDVFVHISIILRSD
jgi:hypothetical protein